MSGCVDKPNYPYRSDDLIMIMYILMPRVIIYCGKSYDAVYEGNYPSQQRCQGKLFYGDVIGHVPVKQ